MSDSDSTVPDGFRVIPGFPRYAINDSGTVISSCGRGRAGHRTSLPWSTNRRRNQRKQRGGYSVVTLHRDGRAHDFRVHVLVLTTFVGPCPDGMQCRHLDGNPANNHVSNLAWGTPRENQHDRIRHGTLPLGELSTNAKLTEKDVLEIRRRAASGETQISIAKNFPVSHKRISKIVRRETWKHI